ncbi:tripartite tricarboxylate transporter TctB family protein [Roseomonas sp. E05]|uniref:tripartite tricarboxylate transporter TctB family protein n=1 Tax=Roseomonas sp. E05 TaxID=3046310 RepID=UPI0024B8A6F4|nr:tripartite tricarboxylate transporter TctB family protein [Roseomonas sp. E05]MDJ0389087.1 tripartite tricarboxylate transporter TctB family protein [Roseomonas sp. E05]
MHLALKERYKDYCGGLILCALGAATALQGKAYHLGTLSRMGPGFMPTALGVLLLIVGLVLLAACALRRDEAAPSRPSLPSAEETIPLRAEWRGWLCICAGVIIFAALAEPVGLIPATFAAVVVTAMGDRENSWRDAILLALGMVIFAVVVFWWGLGVLLPLIKGVL